MSKHTVDPSIETLVDWTVLFPRGNQDDVEMALYSSPGPFPCPGGDIISPFGVFPPPSPGTQRGYRLKAVYYDGNSAGEHNIQISFNLSSGANVLFNLPQVNSAQGASNFHYSDMYTPDPIDSSLAHVFATLVGDAPWDVPAGVYSLILEAHDLPC